MRRGAALICGALALAGCGSNEAKQPLAPIDSEQLNAIATSGPTVAEVLAKDDGPKADAPAKPAAFDYAGAWATKPALCAGNAWRFTTDAVVIGGSARCTTSHAQARTPSEIKLDATCTPSGAGISTNERWSLVKRVNGDMIVARTAGNSIPRTVTLSRCG